MDEPTTITLPLSGHVLHRYVPKPTPDDLAAHLAARMAGLDAQLRHPGLLGESRRTLLGEKIRVAAALAKRDRRDDVAKVRDALDALGLSVVDRYTCVMPRASLTATLTIFSAWKHEASGEHPAEWGLERKDVVAVSDDGHACATRTTSARGPTLEVAEERLLAALAAPVEAPPGSTVQGDRPPGDGEKILRNVDEFGGG